MASSYIRKVRRRRGRRWFAAGLLVGGVTAAVVIPLAALFGGL